MTTSFISLQLYSNLLCPKQVPAFFSASAPSKPLPSSFLYINNQVLYSSCVCQNPWNCPWPFSFSHVSSNLTANHVSFAVKYIQRLSFSSITTSPLNQASIISHLDYFSTSLTSLFVPILGFSESILNVLARVNLLTYQIMSLLFSKPQGFYTPVFLFLDSSPTYIHRA